MLEWDFLFLLAQCFASFVSTPKTCKSGKLGILAISNFAWSMHATVSDTQKFALQICEWFSGCSRISVGACGSGLECGSAECNESLLQEGHCESLRAGSRMVSPSAIHLPFHFQASLPVCPTSRGGTRVCRNAVCMPWMGVLTFCI